MTRQAASRPPTVAFIAHSLNLETGGGSNHSLHQLACGLSEAGYQVKVITLTPERNRIRADAPYEVVEHRLSRSYLSTPRQLVLTQLLFRWQRDVDLFHIEAPSLMTAGGLYRTLGGRVPVVARLHSYSWFCSNVSMMNSTCYATCSVLDRIRHRKEGLARKVLLAPGRALGDILRKLVVSHVDGIASVSDPAAAIEEVRGLSVRRRTTLPPIVGQSAHASTNGHVVEATAAAPLPILYVGRLTREKGVDVLLRAMADIRAPVHLDIVGDGVEMNTLVNLTTSLGVTNDVTFHGWQSQEQVRGFYEKASVFVHPGRWPEPSGRSVVDALASGLPVIASDVGGPPWIAGEAGLTFHAEDAGDLREKIETLTNDASLRASLSDAAPDRVSGFGRDEVLGRLLCIYRELVPAFAEQPRGAS